MHTFDVIIIGAGAAGLMCAIEAGKRGRRVLVLEQGNKCGKKILMSGGGRCNFTNYHVHPDAYLSQNPHFCKSALTRYTQWDFIKKVERHRIPYHEKTLGQLFCDNKASDILNMLLHECEDLHVQIHLNSTVQKIEKKADYHFLVTSNNQVFNCHSLVIATGGLSIPTMGSSPFGYQVAEQFDIKVWPTRAGLVPFTLHVAAKQQYAPLSGIACECIVQNKRISFLENMLFTHRGLSGPAILQISSYWKPGESISINLCPELNLLTHLHTMKQSQPQKLLKTILYAQLPKRLVDSFITAELAEMKMATLGKQQITKVADQFNTWQVAPNGTEGYRTAEVTLGGVDCNALSSKTMEATQTLGLYFIGEVVDVTGWLGGYNFQWAWSSAWVAGQVV